MTIANVSLLNTFDQWRIITNQAIYAVNDIENNNLFYVTSNTASLQVTGNVMRTGTVTIDTNLVTSVADRSTTNIASANLVNTVAESAFAFTNNVSTFANTLNVALVGAVTNTTASFAKANQVYNAVNTVFIVTNSAFSFANSVNSHSHAVAIAANNYAGYLVNSSIEIANTYAGVMANSGNAYTVTVGASGNAYSNLVGLSGNAYTFIVDVKAAAAFGKANDAYGIAIQLGSNAAGVIANSINTYNTLNTAFDVANAAYGRANGAQTNVISAYTVTNASFGRTNSAYAVANAAFDSANNVAPQVKPSFDTANASYETANAGYAVANASYVTTNSAFGRANTLTLELANTAAGGNAYSNLVGASVNAYTVVVGAASNLWANIVGVRANTYANIGIIASYTTANAGYVVANASFDIANGVSSNTTSAFNRLNTAFLVANAAFNSANNVAPQVKPSYDTANAAFVVANAAYGQANVDYIHASAAFDKANVAASPAASSGTLTDGATINWNISQYQIATVTLGGNRTFANPTGLLVGTYILHVIQDATGSRTLTFGTKFKWPAGISPPLTTTAGARDVISFVCDGTNMYGSYMLDVK